VSHLLLLLALMAGLAIYPAGVTLLGASAAALLAFHLGRGRRLASLPLPSMAVLAGAELVALSLPWPGSPLLQLGSLGLAAAPLASLPMTVLGVLWGRPGDSRGLRFGLEVLYPVLVSLMLLGLALVLRSPGWAGLLSARGAGAEIGRVAVAVAILGSLPLWAGSPGSPSGAFRWTSLAGACAFLLIPAMAGWPVVVGLAVWGSCALVLGGAAGAAGRAAGTGWGRGLASRTGRIWIP
jgi:hypothetical protein